MSRIGARGLGMLLLLPALTAGCAPPRDPRPNVLWIVWDTVRADHLSLYGYERATTPFLDEWSRDARVFDDALSPAGYTLPAHASMFTGLLPAEHCTHNGHPWLDDGFVTLAELLRGAGYRTYLYSANPYVSATGNLAQGFELAEHPWSPRFADEALRIVRAKLVEEDRSSELRQRLDAAGGGQPGLLPWNIKAAGEIAGRATLDWLGRTDRGRPFFVLLNYMEAHRPYIPPRAYRERFLDAAAVERSYRVDRSWIPMWEYTFGLGEYSDDEIALTRATYDATVAELDDHLRELMERLGSAGWLENTIVVVTSDHGEHLGEQHMLDHQYSLYQALLRVPLVLRYPPRVAPGRDSRPVMSFDLFPTLLELTGTAPPSGPASRAVSLLAPDERRPRLAEEPYPSPLGVRMVRQRHPEWDPARWERELRSLVEGQDKLIWGSDERVELYDLAADPLESRDLAGERPDRTADLAGRLAAYHASLALCADVEPARGQPTPEQLEILEGLGYVNPRAGD